MSEFPAGFLWGAAVSSHQVEGDNRFNDWWAWEEKGRTKDKSGRACDHYRLFREDLKLAKKLNHNSFRFSIEWSRIEPKEGTRDEDAVSHYKEVTSSCLELGIEPIVTINHFTLPLWFYDLGGWAEKGSVGCFERFIKDIVPHFAEHVKFWLVFNEPMVYVYKSFIEGSWPPGKKSFRDAKAVFKNLVEAHSAAYKIIHKIYKEKGLSEPKVGVAKHVISLRPCSPASLPDRLAVFLRNYFFNVLFVKRLVKRKTLDFIGINYYRREFVHSLGLSASGLLGSACPDSHRHGAGKRNYLGWESYPEGLSEKLIEFGKFNLPILITENGVSAENDEDRWEYIYSHLKEVNFAIEKGVNVIGYLYWSLMDNFEWADGFGPRFGLIEVDYASQRRSPRESAYRFAAVCRENKLR